MMRSIAKSPLTSKTPSNMANGFVLKETQRWDRRSHGLLAVETEKKAVQISLEEII